MIILVSKWPLRNGLPSELVDSIKKTVDKVQQTEPGTLLYSIHNDGYNPFAQDTAIDKNNSAGKTRQTDITFFEAYKNDQAFQDHIHGEVFTKFVKENLHYFCEDPKTPGSPKMQTQFLDRIAAFIRPQAD